MAEGTGRVIEAGEPEPSVNRFFESLAEERGAHAIGIVLSGTGRDGAGGVRAIRVRGGITVAGDERSARHTGTPGVTQDTGEIDCHESATLQRRVFERLHHALRDDVPLFLGSSRSAR